HGSTTKRFRPRLLVLFRGHLSPPQFSCGSLLRSPLSALSPACLISVHSDSCYQAFLECLAPAWQLLKKQPVSVVNSNRPTLPDRREPESQPRTLHHRALVAS